MRSERFDIIKFPIVTEKATGAVAENKYTFKVDKKARKTQIKEAIEEIYNVKVEKINIVNVHPKKKNYRFRIEGYKSGYKKAIVTLKEGDKIAIT
ncbi:MAG TPA: 50S ribosomal protein L23 [bacterium]|nr:50S ribosomal protein L23 [bacterium]HPP29489.1 50S ribosomal protein L23 [bacterium]